MSPFPLGILAASGAGVEAAGAYDFLEKISITDSSTSSITISGFDTTYSQYQHFQLAMTVRSQRGSPYTGDILNITINNDTSANYSNSYLMGNGSGPSSVSNFNDNLISLYRIVSDYGDSSVFSPMIVDILDAQNSSKNTILKSFAGSRAVSEIVQNASAYHVNSVMSSLSISPLANFSLGSEIYLYGRVAT